MAKFKDNYVPSSDGGGLYIGSEEKAELAENGIPFKVTDVAYEPDTQYGEQYAMTVFLPTAPDEERRLSFAAKSNVGSRDDMLEQAVDFFADADAEPFWAKLTKAGRAWIIELADEPAPKTRSRARAK